MDRPTVASICVFSYHTGEFVALFWIQQTSVLVRSLVVGDKLLTPTSGVCDKVDTNVDFWVGLVFERLVSRLQV